MSGAGPALVTVIGATMDRSMNAEVAAALAEHFTVYNYDRRGRGGSTDALRGAPAADLLVQCVERETADLAAVIEAAGGQAVVVGFSSGACLAAWAVAAGVPATHLVLWEAPFSADPGGAAAIEAYRARLSAALDAGDRSGALAAFFRQVGVPEDVLAGMQQSPFWAGGVDRAHTLAYDAAAVGDGPVPADVLGAIGVPTLVLAGGEGLESFRAAGRVAAQATPNARFAILDGQDHGIAGTALAPVVAQFALGDGG